MSDPCEDISAAVATYLSDEDSRGFGYGFQATVPTNPSLELYADHEGLRVLVVPIGETETKETRGSVFVVPQVNVIVTSRSINGETRARLSGLVREMRNSLRFVKMAGWTWQGTETLSKFDAELLRKHQYISAFQLSYQGLVTG